MQKNNCLYMPNVWDSKEMTHTKMIKSFEKTNTKYSANILIDQNYSAE